MVVKTYGIRGLSEWYGTLKAGSLSVDVAFTGGTASPSGARPAYMVEKDPVKQFVIEHSKEFKDGFIYIEMKQETPGNHPRQAVAKTAESSSKATADGKGVKEYPEVTGTQKAIEVLKEYGVDAALIKTKADAKRFAAEKNISFPNL